MVWQSKSGVMTNSDNDNRGKFKILTHKRTSRFHRGLGSLSAIAINSAESNCLHILKLRASRACKWATQLRTQVATTSSIFIQCSKYNSFKCNRLTIKKMLFMWKFVGKSKITSVNFVLLLECCKRHELSFLVWDVWQGLYASIIPLLIKNRFATDSDFIIIPQDVIYDFFLCPCCALGHVLPSTENISVKRSRRRSTGKVRNK